MQKKLCIVILFLSIVLSAYSFSSEEKNAEKIVKDAIASEKTNDGQVAALIRLSWFDNAVTPEVSQFAKKELKEYGQWARTMLHQSVLDAPTSVQKEMIPYILWAYEDAGMGHDLDYIGTFTYLLKTAQRDVKIMALDAFAKYAVDEAYMPIIDAAYDDPSLELRVLQTLAIIANPKSANFLMEKIASPDKAIADAAEQALSKIASGASLTIKRGFLDDRKDVRERCLRIFLPVATIEDISLLYHVQLKSDQFDKKLIDELQKKIDALNAEKNRLEKEAQAEAEQANE